MASYGPTGGTAVPVRAIPSPRPPGVPGPGRPGAGGGMNRPPGRTPAQHMRPGGRPPGGAAREAAQDRREAAQRPRGRPGPAGPERLSRNWLNWSPSQIQNFVRDRTAESVASERLPFQQQAGEIEGNARGASQRLGQAGSWMTGQIGALQAGAEGSAKTFENQVADRAVQQQNAINEQRNQAEKSFGGPLTPGLAGQFVAEQGEAQQSGAAAQRAAGERTQGENNFMRQLREAAAMRSMEGQNAAANTFAGQLGKTRAAERAQIGRVETRGQQEYPKMLQAQMNARLGLGKLGVAQAAVNQREAGNIRTNARGEAGNIRTNATRTATNAATNATRVQTTGMNVASRNFATEVRKELGETSNTIRASYYAAKTHNEKLKAEGKGGNRTKEGREYRNKISEALNAFRSMKNKGSGLELQGLRNALAKGIVIIEGEQKKGKPFSEDEINAAQALVYNGKLSPVERSIAEEGYGMTRQIGGKWFTG